MQHHATTAMCTPSRAAKLVGQYPKRSHMISPQYPKYHPMEYFLKVVNCYQFDVTGIPPDEVTLAEMLSRRGYRTGLVMKWHLGDQPGR
jgi:arylsulfatase D/F/H